jgi:hypothetical protein
VPLRRGFDSPAGTNRILLVRNEFRHFSGSNERRVRRASVAKV